MSLDADRIQRRLGTTGLLADLARARRNDPSTSHAAAERVRSSGALRESQLIVRDAVRRWPGKTAVELGRLLDGTPCREIPREDHWWRIEASRRLAELDPVHVRRGEPRICSIAGTSQGTWWPVERQP